MRVLVACEFSGIVRDAFARRGHFAVSVDLLPTESRGEHIQGDVLDYLASGWDLMIAHPPCTYLTNAGVRHLHSVPSRNGVLAKVHGVERWSKMNDAAEFFKHLGNAPIERICLENPIPHKYARDIIGSYNQLIQPWFFGHGETKATGLWLKNLPPLMATIHAQGRHSLVHKMPPGPDRWKNRSRTYTGIAEAMAAQWG